MTKTNTEKPTGKAEQKKTGTGVVKASKNKMVDNKLKQKISDESSTAEKKSASEVSETKEKKEEEPKKPLQKNPVVKKDKAIVNGQSVPISTKTSIEICRFITKKRIGDAIRELEEIGKMKKALPMRGEIPHKKGKGMMSGRYPKRAIGYFINLLKNLAGNSIANNIEDPVIVEAIANKSSRPYGRFGRWQRKRTHIKIIAIEKSALKKKKKSKVNKKKKMVKK